VPKIIVIGHLLIVKVIVENVVTCFFGTRCSHVYISRCQQLLSTHKHAIETMSAACIQRLLTNKQLSTTIDTEQRYWRQTQRFRLRRDHR